WPPQGAAPADVSGWHEAQAAGGYGYGPAFRGLRAAWRRGDGGLAEVGLSAGGGDEAGRVRGGPRRPAGGRQGAAPWAGRGAGGVMLPFAWQEVRMHAAGAAVLRARVRRRGDGGWSLDAADAAGAPVVSVGSLALRPAAAGELEAAGGRAADALFGVRWVPV